MTDKGVLVAGIGNVFLGDDAFGVEVAQRLSQRQLPQRVRVVDFGIRGMDLSYALLDGFDQAILVDARQQGGPPGTLYVIEPELEDKPDDADPQDWLLSPHDMDPGKVLRIVKAMGGRCRRILLVGCEPASFGTETEEQGRMGLSEPVAAAVDEAVGLIESLISEMLDREPEKVGTTSHYQRHRCDLPS